jgi:hypothetical protein
VGNAIKVKTRRKILKATVKLFIVVNRSAGGTIKKIHFCLVPKVQLHEEFRRARHKAVHAAN